MTDQELEKYLTESENRMLNKYSYGFLNDYLWYREQLFTKYKNHAQRIQKKTRKSNQKTNNNKTI